MEGRSAEVGILAEIFGAVMSRIRADQYLAGPRYAALLPYHAMALVSYDIQDLLEALWSSQEDYSFRESRSGGVLVEELSYILRYPTGVGVALIPVVVQMGDELDVVVEYEDLSAEVVEKINSQSN